MGKKPVQLELETLGTSWSFSARRWDLTDPQRNCPLFRKDLSQAVTYHRRNYAHCTKQKHQQGLLQVHTCIANCSCVLYYLPITRSDIYTLHRSLPFLYGKSTRKYVHIAKPTFFQHIFQKIIIGLTETLTMLSIFKSPTLGFLWLHEKNPIAAIKKKKVQIYTGTVKTFFLLIKNPRSCNFLLNMYRQWTAEVWILPCGKGKEQSSQTALSHMAYLDKGKQTLYYEASLTAEVHRKIKDLSRLDYEACTEVT